MRCYLCHVGETKEESHIIPAFVFRWLKESSPTEFMRGTKEPNKRLQDGVKEPLLCPTCEDLFSKLENEFATNVFREVHHKMHGALAFDYAEWFHRFCVSISWRALTYLCLKNEQADVPFGQGRLITEALERWRLYLLNQLPDVGGFTQHFLIMDTPIEVSGPSTLDLADLGLYIKRGVDFNTVHSPDECHIFSKLCDVLIIGTVYDSKPQQWLRTQVSPKEGRYEPSEFRVSGCLTKFLSTGIEELKRGRAGLSKKQGEKIAETVKRRLSGSK